MELFFDSVYFVFVFLSQIYSLARDCARISKSTYVIVVSRVKFAKKKERKEMRCRCEQRHLPLLIILLSLYCALNAVQCDAGSPFKNRGDRSSGVMMNAANPATLLNPFLSSHGHTVRSPQPQSSYAYNDNYAEQYPSIATVNTNYLPTQNYQQQQQQQVPYQQKLFDPQYAPAAEAAPAPAPAPAVVQQPLAVQQAQKRQFRNPFSVIYEWRQLEYDYATFLERQRAILNGDFVPINNVPLGIDRWRNRLFVTGNFCDCFFVCAR